MGGAGDGVCDIDITQHKNLQNIIIKKVLVFIYTMFTFSLSAEYQEFAE